MAAMTGALSGRTILVTGGASGSGATAARELHRLGATVVIGTRDPMRYALMASLLDNRRVHSFVCDIADEEAVETELFRLALDGIQMTDLVHCAAGGLEPIMRRFVRRLVGLRSMPTARRPGAVEMLRVELRGWLAEVTELAWRINCAAPRSLTGRLLPSLPEGGHVVFYSSLWSSFYGRSPKVPAFYHTVAASKLAFESWLESAAPEWAERGISASIISGHVIRDTQLGRLIDEHLVPLLPPEQHGRARGFFIASADMARVLVDELAAPPPEIGAPARWRYVFGPDQVVDELEPNAPPLIYGTPLADLAMRPVLAP